METFNPYKLVLIVEEKKFMIVEFDGYRSLNNKTFPNSHMFHEYNLTILSSQDLTEISSWIIEEGVEKNGELFHYNSKNGEILFNHFFFEATCTNYAEVYSNIYKEVLISFTLIPKRVSTNIIGGKNIGIPLI